MQNLSFKFGALSHKKGGAYAGTYCFYCPIGHEYVLEKQSLPGVPIDLNAPLDSMETLEFCLVKGGSEFSYALYMSQKIYTIRTMWQGIKGG